MPKGMLGNSELLQGLFRGPILDLLVKLNGEDGERVLEELNRFNRREPCWVPQETGTSVEESVSTDPLQSWTAFYQKYFGLTLDFSGVRIPEKKEGFDYLIVVAKGMSINKVYNTMEKNFNSWKWCDADLESVMQESERGKIKKSYAFWVRDGQETDEDLKNLSAQMIADSEEKIDTENLLERLLHGFKYWSETKKHLDIETVTLCASSRYADGHVPRVDRGRDGDVVCAGLSLLLGMMICELVEQSDNPLNLFLVSFIWRTACLCAIFNILSGNHKEIMLI